MKHVLVFLTLFPLTALLSVAKENDAFAQATPIPADLPVTLDLDFLYRGEAYATREENEPFHGGRPGHGSIWYRWTCERSQSVLIEATPVSKQLNMQPIIAIYRGSLLTDLTPVAHSRSRNSPLGAGASLTLDARKGTTYHIALDCETEVFSRFNFSLSPSPRPFKAKKTLLGPLQKWDYLFFKNASNEEDDPGNYYPDFHKTWKVEEGYLGPDFKPDGCVPIGYGDTHRQLLRTRLIKGPKSSYTIYFRTQFTPAEPLTRIGIEGIFDDGAVLYLNGKEVHRFNLDAEKRPNRWKSYANSEDLGPGLSAANTIQFATVEDLDLPAGEPIDVAVSLHRAEKNHYNMLFSILVYSY